MRFGSVTAALMLGLALASCAPRFLTPGPAIIAPQAAPGEIIARDGTALALTAWSVAAPKAVILALHGFGDYGEAFAMPAKTLNAKGISVYAIDQRGFGDTPVRTRWPGSPAFLDDLTDALAILRARHPGVPLYLMGESMGGAVVLAWAGRTGGQGVAGLILVAPAVWGWSSMNPLYKSVLWLAVRIAPAKTLTGSGLDIWPSDNIEMLKAYSRDPRVLKATRIDALYGLVGLMDRGYEAADRIKVPALVLYGAKDQIVPKSPVLHVVRALGPAGRYAYYPKGYHMLLRDLDGATPTDDVAAYVLDPKGPLPSGLEVAPSPARHP